MDGPIARMRSRHGGNASSRVLRGAFNHWAKVSNRCVCSLAEAPTAAANPVKRKVRRSSAGLSKPDTVLTIATEWKICNARLRRSAGTRRGGRLHIRLAAPLGIVLESRANLRCSEPELSFRDYAERRNIVFAFVAVGFGVELPKNSREIRCCGNCTQQ